MSYKTNNCRSCHDQRNWVILMKASEAHSSPIWNEENMKSGVAMFRVRVSLRTGPSGPWTRETKGVIKLEIRFWLRD